MKNKVYFITSESVTEGHPDKVADFISDSILDECLKQDRNSRVAIETMLSQNKVNIAGQITSNSKFNMENLIREKLKEVDYTNSNINMDYRKSIIETNITKQSENISKGMNNGGAGDQGIMFGFACDETKIYMPYGVNIAHKLAKQLDNVRKSRSIPYLKSDGKVQVTIKYVNDVPVEVNKILISVQHEKGINLKQIRKDIIEKVIFQIVEKNMISNDTTILINPAGKFVIGGPIADTGITGRKIIVDTYGGYAKHGGGSFSGKDATKVDRSAAYMMRHIAKSIVANKLAKKCEIQIAYSIGLINPMSLYLNFFETNQIPSTEIIDIVKREFDLTPEGIIEYLKLREPIYSKVTNYGHFGRDGFSWENIKKL